MSADRITDDWHDLVSYRDDEIARGSLDNFSLPHIFLLHAQSECMFLPFKIGGHALALFRLIALVWAASCVPDSIDGWKTPVSHEIRILRLRFEESLPRIATVYRQVSKCRLCCAE